MKQYWKEITLLLLIKAVLLGGIWYFCFKDPPIMTDQIAGAHILDH